MFDELSKLRIYVQKRTKNNRQWNRRWKLKCLQTDKELISVIYTDIINRKKNRAATIEKWSMDMNKQFKKRKLKRSLRNVRLISNQRNTKNGIISHLLVWKKKKVWKLDNGYIWNIPQICPLLSTFTVTLVQSHHHHLLH